MTELPLVHPIPSGSLNQAPMHLERMNSRGWVFGYLLTDCQISNARQTSLPVSCRLTLKRSLAKFASSCVIVGLKFWCILHIGRSNYDISGVSGLIIDAFGELRDQLEQVKEDLEVRNMF